MYLQSFTLFNFRKFGSEGNKIEFSIPCNHAGVLDEENKEERRGDEHLLATSSTLVIGRNNSGKSTIVTALAKLAGQAKTGFTPYDFNFGYLERLFEEARKGDFEQTPQIKLRLGISLDPDGEDILGNIAEFVTPEMLAANEEIVIEAVWKLSDEALYKSELEIQIDNEKEFGFREYLVWLAERDYKLEFRDKHGQHVENFSLKKLVRFELINANDISRESCLTETFNKILRSRYKKKTQIDVDTSIEELNDTLEKRICLNQAETINAVLSDDVLGSKWKAVLSADITFDKLVRDLLRYDYQEGTHVFPEGQFGMGYTRLMMIIAHIIEHLDSFENGDEKSCISLIAIEEPENHMHPQMQEYFIQYIARVVDHLAEDGDLEHYGQLIITTHSDHIIHSKIQSGNTFNYINYLRVKGLCSSAVVLKDKDIIPYVKDGEASAELFAFLKKHIQLETNNMFFADGIVVVEGQSEKLFLPPYIREKEEFRQSYISIIAINGSHAHVYFRLLRALGIPFVIITDIDFEKNEDDEGDSTKFDQIEDVTNRKTKNATLSAVLGLDKGSLVSWDKKECHQSNGITVFTQAECEGYYPSSFEEALILKNYDNKVLNETLKTVKPLIYKKIVQGGNERNLEQLEENKKQSHKWQVKLASSKGAFISTLMFNLFVELDRSDSLTPSELLPAPDYIALALEHLANEMRDDADAD